MLKIKSVALFMITMVTMVISNISNAQINPAFNHAQINDFSEINDEENLMNEDLQEEYITSDTSDMNVGFDEEMD